MVGVVAVLLLAVAGCASDDSSAPSTGVPSATTGSGRSQPTASTATATAIATSSSSSVVERSSTTTGRSTTTTSSTTTSRYLDHDDSTVADRTGCLPADRIVDLGDSAGIGYPAA